MSGQDEDHDVGHARKAIKLPVKYRVDFGLYRGPRREFTGVAELHDLDAIAEVKGRNYPLARLDEWGGYMLSLEKWLGAETICRTAAVPFYIVISFQGDVRVTTVSYPFPVLPSRISGRTDRGDWQDVEPVVLFRGDMFRPL